MISERILSHPGFRIAIFALSIDAAGYAHADVLLHGSASIMGGPSESYIYSPAINIPMGTVVTAGVIFKSHSELSASELYGTGSGASSVSISGPGVLRNSVTALARDPLPVHPYVTSVQAVSISGFSDIFTLDSPALTGRAGTVNFTLSVHQGFSMNNDYRADFYEGEYIDALGSTVYINDYQSHTLSWISSEIALQSPAGTQRGSVQVSEGVPGGAFGASESLISIPFSMNFIWGQEISFGITVRAEAGAVAGQPYRAGLTGPPEGNFAYASLDMMHTTTWGGFTSVLDENGQAVTEYNYSAESGIDYVHPIPEPASFLLFGLAVCYICCGCRVGCV